MHRFDLVLCPLVLCATLSWGCSSDGRFGGKGNALQSPPRSEPSAAPVASPAAGSVQNEGQEGTLKPGARVENPSELLTQMGISKESCRKFDFYMQSQSHGCKSFVFEADNTQECGIWGGGDDPELIIRESAPTFSAQIDACRKLCEETPQMVRTSYSHYLKPKFLCLAQVAVTAGGDPRGEITSYYHQLIFAGAP